MIQNSSSDALFATPRGTPPPADQIHPSLLTDGDSNPKFWTDVQIEVQVTSSSKSVTRHFKRPYVLLGSHPESDIVLNSSQVARRHLCLLALHRGLYCLDLAATLERQQQTGFWIDSGSRLTVGRWQWQARLVTPNGIAVPHQQHSADYHDQPMAGTYPVAIALHEGREIGRYRVRKPITTIGQSPANKVTLSSDFLSAFHCVLVREADELWIVDLLAANPTMINGSPIKTARVGYSGRVALGDVILKFRRPRPKVGLSASALETEFAPIQNDSQNDLASNSELLDSSLDLPLQTTPAGNAAPDDMTAQRTPWENERDELCQRLIERQSTIDALNAELHLVKQQLLQNQKQLTVYEVASAESRQSNQTLIEQHQQMFKSQLADTDRLENRNRQLTEHIHQIELELATRHEDLQQSQRQLEQQYSEIQSLTTELRRTEELNSEIQSQLAASLNVQAEYQQTLRSYSKKSEGTQATDAALIVRLQQDNRELQQQLEQLIALQAVWQQEQKLQEQRQVAQRAAHEAIELERQNSQRQIEELSGRITERDQQMTALLRELSDVREHNESLVAQTLELQSQCKSIEQSRDMVQCQYELQSQQYREHREEYERNCAELAHLRRAEQLLETQIEALQAERAIFQQQVTEFRESETATNEAANEFRRLAEQRATELQFERERVSVLVPALELANAARDSMLISQNELAQRIVALQERLAAAERLAADRALEAKQSLEMLQRPEARQKAGALDGLATGSAEVGETSVHRTTPNDLRDWQADLEQQQRQLVEARERLERARLVFEREMGIEQTQHQVLRNLHQMQQEKKWWYRWIRWLQG